MYEREDEIDMVLTEVDLPDIPKYEFLETIRRTTSLPVVVYSCEKSVNVMQGWLLKGASFYMSKPITSNDIKNLWQFSVVRRHSLDHSSSNDSYESGVYGYTYTTRASMPKRSIPKMVWTPQLHDKFKDVVHKLGINRACPKEIEELMKVPQLTRRNISSHLQKYRIFMRKKQEQLSKEMLQGNTAQVAAEGNLLSSMPESFTVNQQMEMHVPVTVYGDPLASYNIQAPLIPSSQTILHTNTHVGNPSWDDTCRYDLVSPGIIMSEDSLLQQQQQQQPLKESGVEKLLLESADKFLNNDDDSAPWPGVEALLKTHLN
ncbi:Two-component response regulator ORR25 [Linum perenne]